MPKTAPIVTTDYADGYRQARGHRGWLFPGDSFKMKQGVRANLARRRGAVARSEGRPRAQRIDGWAREMINLLSDRSDSSVEVERKEPSYAKR